MVPETSLTFNQLTRLIAREDFVNFSRRERLNHTFFHDVSSSNSVLFGAAFIFLKHLKLIQINGREPG
jgi:hypothetical protein